MYSKQFLVEPIIWWSACVRDENINFVWILLSKRQDRVSFGDPDLDSILDSFVCSSVLQSINIKLEAF